MLSKLLVFIHVSLHFFTIKECVYVCVRACMQATLAEGGDLHTALPQLHNASGALPHEFSFHYPPVINAVRILGGQGSKK